MTSLTPERHGQGVVFSEANLTFICRKLYWEQFNPGHIDPEVVREICLDRPPQIFLPSSNTPKSVLLPKRWRQVLS